MSPNKRPASRPLNNDSGFTFKKKKPTIPIKETKPEETDNQPLHSSLSNQVVSTHHENQQSNHSRTTIEMNIPLPISETPLIIKNKQFRSKKRSSFGLRGKRTSNSIHGLCAIPHESISHSEWFKFIDAEQPETLRFRQLLSWSASCTPLSLETDLVINLTRKIIEQIHSKQIDLSWYHRESSPSLQTYLPHPLNQENEIKLDQYTKSIELLEQKESEWIQSHQAYISQYEEIVKSNQSKLERIDQLSNKIHNDSISDSIPKQNVSKSLFELMDSTLFTKQQQLDLLKWNEYTNEPFNETIKSFLNDLKTNMDHLYFQIEKNKCVDEFVSLPFIEKLFSQMKHFYLEKEVFKSFEDRDLLLLLAKKPETVIETMGNDSENIVNDSLFE